VRNGWEREILGRCRGVMDAIKGVVADLSDWNTNSFDQFEKKFPSQKRSSRRADVDVCPRSLCAKNMCCGKDLISWSTNWIASGGKEHMSIGCKKGTETPSFSMPKPLNGRGTIA
jgi:hypothetical protein